jgi:hypothetical protein
MQLLKSYDLLVDHQWQAEANGSLKAFRTVQFRRQLYAAPQNHPQHSEGENSQRYLLDQYKLYVEIADRMSSRRMLVNAFFVGLNLVAIALFSLCFKNEALNHSVWELLPFLAISATCIVWWKITSIYRRLNFGRSKAIQKLEQRLPIAPYETEWSVRSNRKSSNLYKSLVQLEYWVPLWFIGLYILVAMNLYLGNRS